MDKKIIAVILAVIVIVGISGVIAYQTMGNNKPVNPTSEPTITPTNSPIVMPTDTPIAPTPTSTPTPTPTVTYKVVKADQYFENNPDINASATDVVITVNYQSPLKLDNINTLGAAPTDSSLFKYVLTSPSGSTYQVFRINSDFIPNSNLSWIEFRVLGNYTIADFMLTYHGDQTINLVKSP